MALTDTLLILWRETPVLLLLKAFVGLSAIYYVGLFLYNILLHPLRKFPGPILAGGTSYYAGYYILTGQQAKYNERLHKKYGAVVRVTPNQLSFITADAWKDIYGHRQGFKQMKKFNRDRLSNGVYSIINAPDDIHSRQRRLLSHAFSEKALREQEPLIQSYVELMISNMRDDAKARRESDMVKNYNYTTFDIIGDLAFAESFNALKSRLGHEWIKSFFDFLKPAALIFQLTTIPIVNVIMPLFLTRYIRSQFAMFRYSKEKTAKRLATKTDRPDLMSYVMRNNESMKTMNQEELEATFNILVIAGSETTATLLSGVTYMLQKHPVILKKLKDEIRAAFKDGRDDITMLKTNQLPYLQAVIEEGLRLYPPVPVALPRITPPEGANISGYEVPGKVIVGVSQSAAYHSELNFEDPLSFIPERWMDKDENSQFRNDQNAVVQPFSVGPRNCLGKNLAYSEMKLVLAKVMYNFDLDLVDEKQKWEDQEVYTLYRKHPLMVLVHETKG